jgi:hypothetical protein
MKHLHGKFSPKIFNSRDAKIADNYGFLENSAQLFFYLECGNDPSAGSPT